MKNKLAKSMSMIIAIAMLISMVPAVVSAESDTTIGTVTGTIGTVDATGSAKVTVEATGITGTMTDYTLLAIRSTEKVELADLSNPATTDAWLEERIEYIDQGNVTDQGVTYDADEGTLTLEFTLRGADLAEMKTRTSSYGDQITVLLGGTNVVALASEADTYQLPNEEAPTLSITNENKEVWAGGAVVLNYSFANDTDGAKATAWEAATKTVYVDGVEKTATIDGGTITFAEGTLNVGKYEEIEITAINATTSTRWNAATLGTAGTKLFEVKSRVAAAKAAGVFGGITVAYDTDENSGVEANQCWITVPALTVTTEEEPVVTITYTLPAVEGAITAIEDGAEGAKIIKIARPEATATEALTVTITADIAAANESNDIATKTYTIKKIGDNGPSFTADDIQIVEQRTGVYRKAGKSLVIISNDSADFDVTNERLVIENDGTQYDLYYVEARNWFVGIVPAYTGDDMVDMEDKQGAAKDQIKAVAYPEETTSADYMVYYGKSNDDSDPAKRFELKDVVGIKKITTGVAGRTDKMYLAADIASGAMDGLVNLNDIVEMKKCTTGAFASIQHNLPINIVPTPAE